MRPLNNSSTKGILVVEPDGVVRSTVSAVVRELDLAQVHQAASIPMGTQVLMNTAVDALVLSLADNDAALDLLIRLRAGEVSQHGGHSGGGDGDGLRRPTGLETQRAGGLALAAQALQDPGRGANAGGLGARVLARGGSGLGPNIDYPPACTRPSRSGSAPALTAGCGYPATLVARRPGL